MSRNASSAVKDHQAGPGVRRRPPLPYIKVCSKHQLPCPTADVREKLDQKLNIGSIEFALLVILDSILGFPHCSDFLDLQVCPNQKSSQGIIMHHAFQYATEKKGV